jgi:hypothetical protein
MRKFKIIRTVAASTDRSHASVEYSEDRDHDEPPTSLELLQSQSRKQQAAIEVYGLNQTTHARNSDQKITTPQILKINEAI